MGKNEIENNIIGGLTIKTDSDENNDLVKKLQNTRGKEIGKQLRIEREERKENMFQKMVEKAKEIDVEKIQMRIENIDDELEKIESSLKVVVGDEKKVPIEKRRLEVLGEKERIAVDTSEKVELVHKVLTELKIRKLEESEDTVLLKNKKEDLFNILKELKKKLNIDEIDNEDKIANRLDGRDEEKYSEKNHRGSSKEPRKQKMGQREFSDESKIVIEPDGQERAIRKEEKKENPEDKKIQEVFKAWEDNKTLLKISGDEDCKYVISFCNSEEYPKLGLKNPKDKNDFGTISKKVLYELNADKHDVKREEKIVINLEDKEVQKVLQEWKDNKTLLKISEDGKSEYKIYSYNADPQYAFLILENKKGKTPLSKELIYKLNIDGGNTSGNNSLAEEVEKKLSGLKD